MDGWLVEKGRTARVYMCVKEVKWELEAASPLKRATILAVAQLMREQMLAEGAISFDVFTRPLSHDRVALIQCYEDLETLRNLGNVQIEAVRKNLRGLGIEVPQYAIDHARMVSRSLEVWMCTVGAGIAPGRLNDVKLIWSYLMKSISHVDPAIVFLRETEAKLRADTGATGPQDMFGDVGTKHWTYICTHAPAFELHR